MDFKDYYSTLGVAKTATEKEIKQAYRKLARKHHPDVNPGDKAAESRFKEINEAYEVLGDSDKRKKYDELGANWRAYEQAGARAAQASIRASSARLERQLRRRWRAPRRRRLPHDDAKKRCARCSGTTNPFSDFFQTFFGGAGPGAGEARGRTRTHAGARAHAPAATSSRSSSSASKTLYNGTMRRFSIQHDGQARTVDVRIPAGVGDGSRVRVAGEGEHGRGRRAVGRSVPADPPGAAPAVRAQGTRPLHARAGSADDRRARRRGRGADARRQVAAAEDSADHAERAGVPAEGPRDAGARQAGRTRRSLRDGGRAAAEAADARSSARTSRRCRSWRRGRRTLRPEQLDTSVRFRRTVQRRQLTVRGRARERHEHMNINKYTEKAREAVAAAIELAQQSNNPQLEPEHLLVALVEQREGIVPELLRKMNAGPGRRRAAGARAARRSSRRRTAARSRACRRG